MLAYRAIYSKREKFNKCDFFSYWLHVLIYAKLNSAPELPTWWQLSWERTALSRVAAGLQGLCSIYCRIGAWWCLQEAHQDQRDLENWEVPWSFSLHILYISKGFNFSNAKITALLESFILLFLPLLLDFHIIKKMCIHLIFLKKFKVVKFTE